MNRSIRSFLSLVLIVLAALLTACGTLDIGVMPTPTPVPTPTAEPTPTPGLEVYSNEEYGFSFEYPSTWTLSESPNRIVLRQGALRLGIGYRRAGEGVSLSDRTGAGGGDFIYGGKVRFLGQVVPKDVLEYERKDKAVFYNGTAPLVTAYGLEFQIVLEDLESDYMTLDLPAEGQAEADQILESFVITRGAFPTTTPASPEEEQAPDAVLAARDAALAYIVQQHPEHAQLSTLQWAGQKSLGGAVGSMAYTFTAGEWAVTLTYPIVAPQLVVYQVTVENEPLSFRWQGEVTSDGQVSGLSTPPGSRSVVGWLGHVASAPEESGFDDYVSFQPDGAGEAGLAGADGEIESLIRLLRDQQGPDEYAHFWGTLTCSQGDVVVDDYGGCQLVVTRLIYGQMYTELEPVVDGWEGILVGGAPGAQFDDYFLLDGDFAVGYGIHVPDDETRPALEALRDSGLVFRVWGGLRAGVPDAFGTQIEVTRFEVLEGETGDPYPGWKSFVQAGSGFSFRYPPAWTLEELPEETLEGGGTWTAAVVLGQGELSITIQYMAMSDVSRVGWRGLGGPYGEAIADDTVTLIGQEVPRMVWMYGDTIKAVEVHYQDQDADLALVITLRDRSAVTIDGAQAAPVTKSDVVQLDQILGSFEAVAE